MILVIQTLAALLTLLALAYELPAIARWWKQTAATRRNASVFVKLLTPLESVNQLIGRLCAWLALAMVLTQVLIVFLRYVFSEGSIGMQESVWYMHGLLFMLGAGYTLAQDEHVRMDVFYRNMSDRGRAWINLLGTTALLLPFCIALWMLSFEFVAKSWEVRETSAEVSGLAWLWLLKTTLLVFAGLVSLQAIILGMKSMVQILDHD